MSTRDPASPRPGRLVLSGVVYALTLFAAGACVWGWAGMAALTDADDVPGARVVALAVGQVGAIGGFVATTFALPRRLRTGPVVGYLFAGLLAAAALGLAVAGAPRVAAGTGIGALAVAGLTWWRVRGERVRAELHAALRRDGRATSGVLTEVDSNTRVNGVPRWRIVVKFADADGTTRWFTTHETTYSPPQTGQRVVVHHDPARPGDTRRIVIDW